jgi:hypothetical protein
MVRVTPMKMTMAPITKPGMALPEEPWKAEEGLLS